MTTVKTTKVFTALELQRLVRREWGFTSEGRRRGSATGRDPKGNAAGGALAQNLLAQELFDL